MFYTKPRKQSDSGPGQGNEGELGWPVLVDKIKIGSPVPLPDDPSDHREPPNGWASENNYPDEDDPPFSIVRGRRKFSVECTLTTRNIICLRQRHIHGHIDVTVSLHLVT